MKYFLIFLLALILALLIYALVNNRKIETSVYTLKAPVDLRIVHLSDIHNTKFKDDYQSLLTATQNFKPDLICMSGDLIDKRTPNAPECYQLAVDLLKIAPVYYVSGNHEDYLNKKGRQFVSKLKDIGFFVVDDEKIALNEEVEIVGLKDINQYSPTNTQVQRLGVSIKLNKLINTTKYKIMLVHQPQLFDVYRQYDIDLVLAGHTHGGIIRLPFIGGIFAPGQGFFPKYDAGIYNENDTTMIISRGLGKALVPLRFCCNPEVVCIELKKEL